MIRKTAIIILALISVAVLTCCGKENTADTAVSDTASVKVMSYSDYTAAAIGAPVAVETYIQAKQSRQEGKASFYTQSEDGAYFIYQMACTEEEYNKLVTGTKIRVSGEKADWSGEIEIANASFEILDDKYIAEPTDVTGLIGTNQIAGHQNKLVKFEGLTVEPKTDTAGNSTAFLYNWDGSGEEGDDLYFDASVNGKKCTFTVESSLCGPDTDVYKAVKSLKAGDVIDLTGFLYWYEGANPHITDISVR